MKSKIFSLLTFFLLLPFVISALQLNIDNPDVSFQNQTNIRNTIYTIPILSEETVISYLPGAPAIPVKTIYFELPAGEEISSVSLNPINSRNVALDYLPAPIQQAYPLSQQIAAPPTLPEPKFYTRSIYPENPVYEFSTIQIGSHNIGRISYYIYNWNSTDNSANIPDSYEAEISLVQNRDQSVGTDTYASNRVLESLGFSARGESESIKYLIITTQNQQEFYNQLLEFRNKQGILTYLETIENISQTYSGIDLQEKIRNCIKSYQADADISFVTLAGDVDTIPDRKIYAFDCAFGAYDDENDIPGDMYYSCLDGDWNANGNDVYGEDDDLVDYYPDVFVSRLPLQNDEIESYISMLIDYESGYLPEYNRAAGFSMELWTGSNSEVCQQFIYNKYFPDYYDISFITGDENTTENAYELLNANQNIIQHTGHAGKTVLSLENGYVRNTNLDMLDNQYGGIFYSIGCWSAALDYDSIGENLVTIADKGVLGYVGNSRYGWGAPAAPGFGFSEFFQKEFMKNIFRNNVTLLAEANALQKLPFIPFFEGTSVFKWVAYELNAIGDSYYRLNTNNPQTLDYSVSCLGNEYQVTVTTSGYPVEEAFVTLNNLTLQTDLSGIVSFISEISVENISIYKPDFIMIEESVNLSNFNWDFELASKYEQGFSYSILLNFLASEGFPSFQPEIVASEFIEIISSPPTLSSDHTEFQLDFRIKSAQEVELLTNNLLGNITINLPDNYPDLIIPIKIAAADFSLVNLNYDSQELHETGGTAIELVLQNKGESGYSLNSIHFQISSHQGSFSSDNQNSEIFLNPGEYLIFNNTLQLDTTPADQEPIEIQISMNAENSENVFSISRTLTLFAGNIFLQESFETQLTWLGHESWQTVDNYGFESNQSLSCRPVATGQFLLQSPQFIYQSDLILDFHYRYKMPMYGKDGVYFIIETETTTDTLIFLGAGGALNQSRDAEVYIESNWDLYSIELDEALSSNLLDGENCRLNLVFNYEEEIEDFNQYALMEDIGIFIDNLYLGKIHEELEPDDNAENDTTSLKIYPNPFTDFGLKILVELPKPEKIKVEIYNVKGQKIRNLEKDGEKGKNLLVWNGFNKNGKRCSSGVYLLKIASKSKKYYRKIVYIK